MLHCVQWDPLFHSSYVSCHLSQVRRTLNTEGSQLTKFIIGNGFRFDSSKHSTTQNDDDLSSSGSSFFMQSTTPASKLQARETENNKISTNQKKMQVTDSSTS